MKHFLFVVLTETEEERKLLEDALNAFESPAPSAPLEPALRSPTTIEAESMTLLGYAKEGNRIRATSAMGTASFVFNGVSGKYDMQVHVVPEDDGRPTLEVFSGSTKLASTYTYPKQTQPTSFMVSNVFLNKGDVIKLVGRPNGGAHARIDKVMLIPV